MQRQAYPMFPAINPYAAPQLSYSPWGPWAGYGFPVFVYSPYGLQGQGMFVQPGYAPGYVPRSAFPPQPRLNAYRPSQRSRRPENQIPSPVIPDRVPLPTAPPQTIDLRSNPNRILRPSSSYNTFSYPFGSTTNVLLVCSEFPWTIEIHDFTPISWAKVHERVYSELREKLTEAEWELAGESRRTQIEDARSERKRGRVFVKDAIPRRIDWLGNMTVVSGVEKADDGKKRARLPGMPKCETWVLKLQSR